MDDAKGRQRRSDAGFTLIEILIVVAIVGLIASIAIPLIGAALQKARRNAAVSDMRVLRDGLQRYAIDEGHYPLLGGLDPQTLAPISPRHITSGPAILKCFASGKIDSYLPYNPFTERITVDALIHPQSYVIIGTLRDEPDRRFVLTDAGMYFLVGSRLYPIQDEGRRRT